MLGIRRWRPRRRLSRRWHCGRRLQQQWRTRLALGRCRVAAAARARRGGLAAARRHLLVRELVCWRCGSGGEGAVRGGELHGACAAAQSPAAARPRTLCAHAAAASASAPAACWLLAQLARARAAAAAAARPPRASRAPAACPSTPGSQVRAFALHATAFASRNALQLCFPILRQSAVAALYSAFYCWRSACVSPNSLLLGAAEGHGDARVERVA